MSLQAPTYAPPSWQGTGDGKDFKGLQESVKKINEYLLDKQSADTQYFNQLSNTINVNSNGFGADLASAATISPTQFMHTVTGTATISNIATPPDFNGQLALISRDGFSFTNSGNVASTETFAATTLIMLIYFPPTTKWYVVSKTQLANSIITSMIATGAIYANGSTSNSNSVSLSSGVDTGVVAVTLNINATQDFVVIQGRIVSSVTGYAAPAPPSTGPSVTTKLWRGPVGSGTLIDSVSGNLAASTTPTLAGAGGSAFTFFDTGASGSTTYNVSMNPDAGPSVTKTKAMVLALDWRTVSG